MSEVLGKPVRSQQIPFEAYKSRLIELGMSEAMAQGRTDMAAAKNNGLDNRVPRRAENTTPISFRQWCDEVLKPAVLSGPNDSQDISRRKDLWILLATPSSPLAVAGFGRALAEGFHPRGNQVITALHRGIRGMNSVPDRGLVYASESPNLACSGDFDCPTCREQESPLMTGEVRVILP
jgi:hypothetical protein